MRRFGWVVLLLILLTGCTVAPPALPTASPELTPVATGVVTAPANSLLSPEMLPTPAPASQVNPAEVLGIRPLTQAADKILYARADGAVILHDLIDGSESELLGSEQYTLDPAAGEGYFLFPMRYPVAVSPDSADSWLVIPTQSQGTWLTSADGRIRRRIFERPLAVTWSPDSRRIAYTHNWGQEHPRDPNVIFVRDVVHDKPERRLAALPAPVKNIVWAPDCLISDRSQWPACRQRLAATTYGDAPAPHLNTWLVNASTGAYRELCRYSAPGRDAGSAEYLWAVDAGALWALPGWRVCPIDGTPQPLSRALTPGRSDALSPGRHLTAKIDADANAIIVRRTDIRVGVRYSQGLHDVRQVQWLDDVNYLAVIMGSGQSQTIAILDLSAGKLTPVAQNVLFLGVMSQLRQRHVAWMDASQDAGEPSPADPDDWLIYRFAKMHIMLQAPATWRVQVIGAHNAGRIVIANFDLKRQAGLLPLQPDQMEIVISRAPAPVKSGWIRMQRNVNALDSDVEVIEMNGRPAVRIKKRIAPLSEEIRIQINDHDELHITRSPLTPAYDAVFQQILNSIRWGVN